VVEADLAASVTPFGRLGLGCPGLGAVLAPRPYGLTLMCFTARVEAHSVPRQQCLSRNGSEAEGRLPD